jgi:hypothetical protein
MKILDIGTYGWTEAPYKGRPDALTGHRHWIPTGTEVTVLNTWKSQGRTFIRCGTQDRTLYAWVDSGDVIEE